MTDTKWIVSVDWLAEHIDDRNLVVVDCRFALADPELGRRQYLTQHIPNAFYLHLNEDLSSAVKEHGGRHPLPDVEKLAKTLSAIGITSGETQVVVYDDSRFAFAARFWWLLRYLGHDRVALLDGGYRAWETAGYPVTDALPNPTPGEFIPNVRSQWVVNIEQVRERKDLPGVVLVDSRDRDRYLGKHEPIDPIAGHIPGAVNYPWQEVSDDRGRMRSREELQRRWQEIAHGREIIVYCGSGVTACVNLFSLELAGIAHGQLYAGSWSDWCSYQG
ncbi:sulfurtransferase [Oxynema aestuarii]|jgi:thiosulfate/3-mercaptopyruvate sulfurtransferase|uniref:Sulfurtransferase n=1 Tax=Oxynema aestuarii AP17 TaxID=2064643 RepID=A0A6H1TU53_9CYAN|nr:sulfurtransferase [Oxynema aestuarii]QIZ70148.1 sulfurtransferase [Oxynema aestuarii AP17]RMH74092.1 MAG: sulfurtransferase [Cyanobacteria bacterium J007]